VSGGRVWQRDHLLISAQLIAVAGLRMAALSGILPAVGAERRLAIPAGFALVDRNGTATADHQFGATRALANGPRCRRRDSRLSGPRPASTTPCLLLTRVLSKHPGTTSVGRKQLALAARHSRSAAGAVAFALLLLIRGSPRVPWMAFAHPAGVLAGGAGVRHRRDPKAESPALGAPC